MRRTLAALLLFLAALPALGQAGGPSYQALWWASPAGSENGWGMNITHQGDTLFVTWFTYDSDGSPMWLVISNADRAPDNSYSGPVYRTTGPAYNEYTAGAFVGVTQVGSARFTFSSAEAGTVGYSVNGILQIKQIVRQVFSSPVPSCVVDGAPTTARNYQDLWWRSPAGSESGWGLNIAHQGDVLFVTWFTYDADGKGTWFVMSDARRTGPETYSGTLYRTRGNAFSSSPWDSSSISVSPAGSAILSFTDANNGSFSYNVDGLSRTKPITRQVFATPATVCS